MAREVRMLPPLPRAVGAALALLLFLSPTLSIGNEKAIDENRDVISARARLLQDLERQLEDRRREVTLMEERLSATTRALETVKQDLSLERERLEELKREVEAEIARRDRVVDERLSSLAKVYGQMKPKEAAEAMEKMDDDTTVGLLERLPGRAVARIFNVMSKDRVRELTRRLEKGKPPKGD